MYPQMNEAGVYNTHQGTLLQKMHYTHLVMNHMEVLNHENDTRNVLQQHKFVHIRRLHACTIFTDTQVGILNALYLICDKRRAVTTLKQMATDTSIGTMS
jgi:hypothetical protein